MLRLILFTSFGNAVKINNIYKIDKLFRYLISCMRNPKSAPLSVSAILRKTTSKNWNVKNLQDLEQADTLLEAYRNRAYKWVAYLSISFI